MTHIHMKIYVIYIYICSCVHIRVYVYTVSQWISMWCVLNILNGNYLSFNLPFLPLHTPPVPGTSSAFYLLNILPLFPHQWLLSSPLTLQMLQVNYTNLNMSKLGSRNDCKTMAFELLVQSYVPQYAIFKFYCKFHSFDFFLSRTNFILYTHHFFITCSFLSLAVVNGAMIDVNNHVSLQ